MRILSAALLLAAATPFAGLRAQQEPARGRLRAIVVHCGDVFDDATAATRRLAGLVDAIHWETREEVVRREIWLQPDALVTTADAAEVERHLRALGLFAEVTAALVPVGDGTQVDLEVSTRDRLSLVFGASGSYVGGVSGYRIALGENNLVGLGDRLGASFYENSTGEFRGSAAYTDLHVFDTWHQATLRASRTDEGDSFGLDVRRPLKHLADPHSHTFALRADEDAVDYYRFGDSQASVHERSYGGAGDITWAAGPPDHRHTLGIVATVDDRDYAPATGPLGPQIRVPGATRTLFLGLAANFSDIAGYRELHGYDTLDYVQDLTLGVFYGATLGARWRDEDGAGSAVEPELAARVSWATEPLPDTFLDLAANGAMRWRDGAPAGWSGQLGAWAYAPTGEHNVLAASCTLDGVDEREDLPIELTLGADNGLRGYASRDFAGTSRLRLNCEDRLDLGVDIATVHCGAVAFYDAGWVGEHGDLGRRYDSVGVGLRIGGRALFGDSLLRLDLAYPLQEVPGETGGWQLGVSVGQVFTFGGNASALTTR